MKQGKTHDKTTESTHSVGAAVVAIADAVRRVESSSSGDDGSALKEGEQMHGMLLRQVFHKKGLKRRRRGNT